MYKQIESTMIDFETLIFAGGTIKAILLLFSPELIPNEDYEKWLQDDGFVYSVKEHGHKKFVFDELAKAKDDYRQVWAMCKGDIPFGFGSNILQAHKNRISKLRLIIKHEVVFVDNKHARSGISYVIARTYWIDIEGKKVRKFSKNLGPVSKVYINGKDGPKHQDLVDKAEKELDQIMWDKYREEYKEEKI